MIGRDILGYRLLPLAAPAALVFAIHAQAEPRVYRCVDAKGRVTYTQTGCDPASAQRRLDERPPAPVPPPADREATADPGAAARGTPARRPAPSIRRPVESGGLDDSAGAAMPVPSSRPVLPELPKPVHAMPDTELEAPDHSSRRAAPR